MMKSIEKKIKQIIILNHIKIRFRLILIQKSRSADGESMSHGLMNSSSNSEAIVYQWWQKTKIINSIFILVIYIFAIFIDPSILIRQIENVYFINIHQRVPRLQSGGVINFHVCDFEYHVPFELVLYCH